MTSGTGERPGGGLAIFAFSRLLRPPVPPAPPPPRPLEITLEGADGGTGGTYRGPLGNPAILAFATGTLPSDRIDITILKIVGAQVATSPRLVLVVASRWLRGRPLQPM